MYLPFPNLGLTPPVTYNPNARGSDACRGSNSLWTTTMAGLRRRQYRTEHKGHTPNPRREIKIPDPAGNRTRAADLEDRDSTDHAMAMDSYNSLTQNIHLH